MSVDAFGTKLLPELLRQLAVASEKPRLQHGRFRAHVTVGLSNRFLNGPCGVSNLEAAVPQQIEHLIRHLLQVRRNLCHAMVMQHHHVNVTERVKLTPAISAKGD